MWNVQREGKEPYLETIEAEIMYVLHHRACGMYKREERVFIVEEIHQEHGQPRMGYQRVAQENCLGQITTLK